MSHKLYKLETWLGYNGILIGTYIRITLSDLSEKKQFSLF